MLRTKNLRAASELARSPRVVLLGLLAAVLATLCFSSSARADLSVCTPGTAAGKCEEPQGLATDFETGRLYVADKANNRIDVFESDGTFVMAFGWGVDTGAAKLETCTTASTCQAGKAGSGAGQFSSPTWIAVDNYGPPASRQDVYVGTDNFHVQRFKPSGELVKAFGSQGTGPCQFNRAEDPIAVGPGGDVYVADRVQTAPTTYTNRIERFDSEGNCKGEVELFKGASTFITKLAVDSGGNSYVTVEGAGGVLRKYDPSGALLYELDKDTPTEGIAVDAADNVFAKQLGFQLTKPALVHLISEYDSAGNVLRRFAYVPVPILSVPALAAFHSASGDVFASQERVESNGTTTKGVNYLSLLPAGPVIVPEACKVKEGGLGNTKATLVAEVNPEGKATSAHFEYVTEEQFQAEGFEHPEETEESASLGSDFELHEAAVRADVAPETTYRCRVIATNADAPAGIEGQEGTFTSKEALEFGPTTVSDVQTEAATLNAVVNPLGIETNGFFEYVEEATYLKDIEELGPEHGFDHAAKAPTGEELDFGSSEEPTLRSTVVSGLKPGTSYRFRIVATNAFAPLGIQGPTGHLRTFGTANGGLPDDRAWELVSPAEKNSAEVVVPGWAGGLTEERTVRVQAGSASGEALTYTSWTSFGDAESAPATSQYLSKRTPAGWSTENISPLGFEFSVLSPPFSGFDPELATGVVKVSEPPLTTDCPAGFENLYLRDNASGELRCLTPEAPDLPPGRQICFNYAGASADQSHVFFASTASYAGAPKSEDFLYSLYEWSAADGKLRPVSVLPGASEAVAPTEATSFGPRGSVNGVANCQVGQSILRNAISADGSRVFWSYVPEDASKPSQLLARVNGEETIQLDKPQSGGKGGNGVFWAASKDGSVVYFTDETKLVSGSNSETGKPDLYRYEFEGSPALTDLTKGPVAGDVKGVVGASDDGSYLYFVAGAVLSEEANEAGQKAVSGKNNLYLFHEGSSSFIATLEEEDNKVWDSQPKIKAARISPDGRHLAFLSIEAEALAGYDSTMLKGEHCRFDQINEIFLGSRLCPQAFLYDAESKDLSCASCNPSGSRPLGQTLLPGWSNMQEGPRYLSDDGSRLFFESYDALTPADENGKRDVYEFELEGKGSCTNANPALDSLAGGCRFLISSGKSSDSSFFVDASSDGRDVFFSTRSALTGWDTNENYDVYDARVGGGFAEPSVEPVCQGEGCKPPVAPAPSGSSPTTPTVVNPGNPKSAKPRHHKKKHAKKKPKHRSQKQRSNR